MTLDEERVGRGLYLRDKDIIKPGSKYEKIALEELKEDSNMFLID